MTVSPGLFTLKNCILAILVSQALVCCNSNSSSKAYKPVFASDTTDNSLIVGFPSFSYSESAEPLIKYLNNHLQGVQLRMKACITYEEYLEYLDQKKFDISFVNGIIGLESEKKGYSIVGKLTDDNQYSGIIFTRKNANIKKVMDLKGKSVALVPFQKIPGTMMPLYFLHQQGLDVNHDIHRVNVSSFESTIISTFLGKTDAGLCLKRNWTVYIKQHPEILTKVEVAWETPPLINNAMIVKKSINPQVLNKILDVFFTMHNNEEGKRALSPLDIFGFEKADSDTYKPMLEFKKKYDAAIF